MAGIGFESTTVTPAARNARVDAAPAIRAPRDQPRRGPSGGAAHYPQGQVAGTAAAIASDGEVGGADPAVLRERLSTTAPSSRPLRPSGPAVW